MTIETLGIRPADTLAKAQESTVLSPRFYTTDFAALDKLDVSPVRAEWDKLIAEMQADPNKSHFKRNAEWDHVDLAALPEGLRRELVDFLVSRSKELSGGRAPAHPPEVRPALAAQPAPAPAPMLQRVA